MGPKIYLSKSKAGNPDHIRMVKDYLAKYDCEILEFEGGTYSFDILDKTDYFVLIPPNHDFDAGDDKVLVGKGQWAEYDHYMTMDPAQTIYKRNLPRIVVNFQTEIPVVAMSDTCDIISEDWKTKYATLDIPYDGFRDENLAEALDLKLKGIDSVSKKLFKF